MWNSSGVERCLSGHILPPWKGNMLWPLTISCHILRGKRAGSAATWGHLFRDCTVRTLAPAHSETLVSISQLRLTSRLQEKSHRSFQEFKWRMGNVTNSLKMYPSLCNTYEINDICRVFTKYYKPFLLYVGLLKYYSQVWSTKKFIEGLPYTILRVAHMLNKGSFGK